jgi:hypothetical protein
MTDYSKQRRSPRRHPPTRVEDEGWLDEQDSDASIEDEQWPPRTHTSAVRYQSTSSAAPPGTAIVRTTTPAQRMRGIPARRSALLPLHSGAAHAWPPPVRIEREPPGLSPRQRAVRHHFHWSLWLGLGMLAMILGWLALGALGNWWQTTQDDWRYGYPRTFQIDAIVGHNHVSPTLPSHFLAINLNRHIFVIELPAGDATKTRIYNGPVLLGPGQERTPVTLSFQDVNGDGKLDLLVWVADTHIVFINDGGGFRPALPRGSAGRRIIAYPQGRTHQEGAAPYATTRTT